MMFVVPGDPTGKMVVLGLPKFAWFKALKNSPRMLKVSLSATTMFLLTERSSVQAPGPTMVTTYRQAKQVYRNRGNGSFEDLSARTGAAITAKKASRRAAFEDLDGDGDLDIVVANLNDLPSVLRNNGGERNHWLMLRLEGAESNRSAIGARIEVTAGGLTQTDEVRSASSFYSSNGLRVHFGLGAATEAESVEVHWPSGAHQKFEKVRGNRVVLIHEKEGVVSDPSE